MKNIDKAISVNKEIEMKKEEVYTQLNNEFGLNKELIKQVLEVEREITFGDNGGMIPTMKKLQEKNLNIPQLIYLTVSTIGMNRLMMRDLKGFMDKEKMSKEPERDKNS